MTSGTVIPAEQKLLWTFEVGGWEVGVEFVDDDSLSACAFLRMSVSLLFACACVWSSVRLCLSRMCVYLSFQRHMSPWEASPRSSCPFHHVGASAVSGDWARFLGLFKIVGPQQSPQLHSHPASTPYGGRGGAGLTSPKCSVQVTVL